MLLKKDGKKVQTESKKKKQIMRIKEGIWKKITILIWINGVDKNNNKINKK